MKKMKLLALTLTGIISLGLFTGCMKSNSTDDKNTNGSTPPPSVVDDNKNNTNPSLTDEKENQNNSNESTADKNNTENTSKPDETEEKAFTTVPEENLIPDFIKKRYSKFEELKKDYALFVTMIDNVKNNKPKEEDPEGLDEFKSKYGFSGTNVNPETLRKENPEFFEGAISYQIMMSSDAKEIDIIKKDMLSIAKKYLGNSLLGEKNSLDISKEFTELEPFKYVNNYLKKNKIEITKVVSPKEMKMFHNGLGTNIFTTEVTIEGTQNGKAFSKTRLYDFHFSSKEDIRNGKDYRKKEAVELMAVTESVEGDLNKLIKKFK